MTLVREQTASVVVYEHLTWGKFLITTVMPEAKLIKASVDHTAGNILDHVSPLTTHFVFHLNCTFTGRFPVCRAELLAELRQRGVQTINSRVTDISKRTTQQLCRNIGLNVTLAPRDGDGDELLIVKTDMNSAGTSEQQFSPQQLALLGVSRPTKIIRLPEQYQVIRRKEIPETHWEDSDLVIERFIGNRHDRWYRVFLFLDRFVVCRLVSDAQIKKVGRSDVTGIWRFSVRSDGQAESLDHGFPLRVVEQVLYFSKEFGLEFGTIDLMEDDTETPFIVDVNSTPAYVHPIDGLAEHLRTAMP